MYTANYSVFTAKRLSFLESCACNAFVIHEPCCESAVDQICNISFCIVPTTVKHILIDCGVHQNVRNKYYTKRSLKGLFKSNKNAEIIQFLKKIELYQF